MLEVDVAIPQSGSLADPQPAPSRDEGEGAPLRRHRVRQGGELGGLRRLAYDGTELALSARDVAMTDVTTRDIDRGSAPHFLLKELQEAPASLHKTLRGRLIETDGIVRSVVGETAMPPEVARRRMSCGVRRKSR